MHVINKRALGKCRSQHADVADALKEWRAEVRAATWTSPNDIRERYTNASILKGDRVIFRIKGNKYRLIAQINYSKGVVRIRFVGTHEQYDRINAETV